MGCFVVKNQKFGAKLQKNIEEKLSDCYFLHTFNVFIAFF